MGQKRVFAETRMFYYHRRLKIAEGLLWIFGILFFASLVIAYFFILRKSEAAPIIFINQIASHISANIVASSLMGILYTALIGGLFFILMPMEVLFARFAASDHNFLIILVIYLAGIMIAYIIDYYLGMKLTTVSKKLISPRKFYKIKGKINKYGSAAVFIFNVLPFPSQILSAILGVFKYNKTRFLVFVFLGQFVKCTAIGLGVYYFL